MSNMCYSLVTFGAHWNHSQNETVYVYSYFIMSSDTKDILKWFVVIVN